MYVHTYDKHLPARACLHNNLGGLLPSTSNDGEPSELLMLRKSGKKRLMELLRELNYERQRDKSKKSSLKSIILPTPMNKIFAWHLARPQDGGGQAPPVALRR